MTIPSCHVLGVAFLGAAPEGVRKLAAAQCFSPWIGLALCSSNFRCRILRLHEQSLISVTKVM